MEAATTIALYDNMQALCYMREVSGMVASMKAGSNPLLELTNHTLFEMEGWEEAYGLCGQVIADSPDKVAVLNLKRQILDQQELRPYKIDTSRRREQTEHLYIM